jgi:pimeloyl-ACP methyl ester carboxylesterase
MAPEIVQVSTRDGLALDVARVRGGAKTPAWCIPGLTRNRRDFEAFAAWLAATGRDVYAVSLRGRGASDYDPNYLNYRPAIYCEDMLAALDQLGLARAVFVGTSLGGIVTMLTSLAAPDRVAAAIINDVGPELAPEGIARIASYVGGGDAAANLDEAATQIRAINQVAFPGRDTEFWRDFARNTFRETPDGAWVLDYDQAIATALAESGPLGDLWPAFSSLGDKPALLLRGAISDLLSPEIVARMQAVHSRLAICEVAGVGHAPTLAEPEAMAAIETFLSGLD